MALGFHPRTMALMQKVIDLPFRRLESEYEIGTKQLLSRGGFGQVYQIVRKKSGQRYALKEIPRNYRNKTSEATNINRERYALKTFDSPFIIKLHNTYSDGLTVYFILDLAENGDLFHHIAHVPQPIQVASVRFFAAEIVMGLQYLRSMNFVHRDLKLENVLVDRNWHVKISDFGSAKTIGQSQGTSLVASVLEKNSITGTRCFVAPEVWFQEDVTFGTDYWALGFMIFRMYTNKTLAHKDRLGGEDAYFHHICARRWKYPFVSPDQQIHDLVVRLTRRNPIDRVGTVDIQALKDHVFFQGVDWDSLTRTVPPGIQLTAPGAVRTGICRASTIPLLLPYPPNTPIAGALPTAAPPAAAPAAAAIAARTRAQRPVTPATGAKPLASLDQTPVFSTTGPADRSLAKTPSRMTPSTVTPTQARPRHVTKISVGSSSVTSGYRTNESAQATSTSNITQSMANMWKQMKSPPPGDTQSQPDGDDEKDSQTRVTKL